MRELNEVEAASRLARVWVTGLGVGCFKLAPGTWGSLEGVALAAAIDALFPQHYSPALLGLVLVLGIPGLVFSTQVSRADRDPDPAQIVIDEVVGQLFALMWIPFSAFSVGAGFLLFRFFDIVKPFPARHAERLQGGLGIMADDLVAAADTAVVLNVFLWLRAGS